MEGVIKHIDEQGRIVFPRGYILLTGWDTKTPLQVSLNEDKSMTIKKYEGVLFRDEDND